MPDLLTDDDIFGRPGGGSLLSDDDIFGKPSKQASAVPAPTAKLDPDPTPARPPLTEDSYAELGQKFAENLGPMFQRQVGGALQATGESFNVGGTAGMALAGDPAMQEVADIMRQRAADPGSLAGLGRRLAADAEADLKANAPNVDPDSVKGYAYDIATSIANMGPAIAAGLVTKSPTVSMGLIGSQVYGDRYAESRAAGRTPEQSGLDATFYAAAEAIPEALPLGVLFKPGTKFLGRVLKTAGAEAVQEVFTEALQSGYDAGVLGEDMTWGEAWDRLVRAGIVGGGTGGGIATATHPFVRGDAETTPDPSQRLEPTLERPTAPLTEEDRASPLPDDLIGEGKAIMDAATGTGASVPPLRDEDRENEAGPDSPLPGLANGEAGTPREQTPPDGFEPLFDEAGAKIGMVNMETGEVRREGQQGAVSEPTPAATPEAVPEQRIRSEEAAPAVEPTEAPAAEPVAAVEPEPASAVSRETEPEQPPAEPTGDGTRAAPVVARSAEDIERAGQQVAEPTEGQKEAGNYKKGHVQVAGLDVTIENPKGSERSGKDASGETWRVTMPAHYGYVKRTEGADGDHVDVYLGDVPTSTAVWVVDQIDVDTRKFDEHKAMVGFASQADAIAAYDTGFSDGRGAERRGAVTPMSTPQFQDWLANGDTTKPLRYEGRSAPVPNNEPTSTGKSAESTNAERPAQPEAATADDGETWWEKELTAEGRRQIADAMDKKGMPKAAERVPNRLKNILWQHITPDTKRRLLALRRTQADPVVSEAPPKPAAEAAPVEETDAEKAARLEVEAMGGTDTPPPAPPITDQRIREHVKEGLRPYVEKGWSPADLNVGFDTGGNGERGGLVDIGLSGIPKGKARYTSGDITRDLPLRELWAEIEAEIEAAKPAAEPEAKPRDSAETPEKPARAPKEKAERDSTRAANYGSKNRLVTSSAADAARERLRAKLKSQLNSGLDPELMTDGMTLAVYHIEAGARRFADYAAAMIEDLGQEVRPYLRSFYEAARHYPGVDADKLSPPAEIDAWIAGNATPESQSGIVPAEPGEETADGGQDRAPETGDVGQDRVGEAGDRLAAGQRAGTPAADLLENQPAEDDGGRRDGGDAAGARAGEPDARGEPAVRDGGDGTDGRPRAGRAGVADPGAGERRDRDQPDPPATRPNYHVTDPEALIGGTPKVRFGRNRAAIEAYRAITEEGRDPTPAELDAMAAYIGWGSFGQELFQGNWANPRPKDGWQKEDAWLREHLGQTEWESAQRSIINAHYTDPPTVTAMWNMVRRMGFAGGRVLEPSMGIGNFFGLMPRDLMAKSDLTGIELDEMTGGMAKLLYPGANIQIKGYEASKTPDDFYDLVIGNWPFAAQGPADRRYDKFGATLHDYFFIKALDQVRPGGIVIGITSAGTMDKQGRNVRLHLARHAELVGAFRMPAGAFEQYAGTHVVADIIVLKKRERAHSSTELSASEGRWIDTEKATVEGHEINLNQYWGDKPDHVLGTFGFGRSTVGRQAMTVYPPKDFAKVLADLPAKVAEGAYAPVVRGKEPRFVTNNTTDRHGAVTVQDGALYVVQGERLAALEDLVSYKVKDKKKTADREAQIRALVDLRRSYGALIDAERDGAADTEKKRASLKRQYQAFAKAHGPIGPSDGLSILKRVDDPFHASLAALETVDGKPARILSEATTRGRAKPKNPTVRDAFILARNESMHVDMARIAEIAGKPQADAERELLESKAVYRTPGAGFEVADVYLSGNVRRKLREAQEAAEAGEDMAGSIEALRAVLPKDVPYFQIEAKLGAPWVENGYYADFINHLLGTEKGGFEVAFRVGRWVVKFEDKALNRRPEATTTWGMQEYRFDKLLSAAMNNLSITIKYKDSDGNYVVDEPASKEANEKALRIREEFAAWAWRDAERRVDLERDYNEAMNAVAIPQFDGGFMEFPGMALHRGDDPFSLRSHQVNAIWRGIANGRGLYAHEVGTGKTYTMAGIAVESRRYGLARKPLLLAHNANSATVAREITDMYPGAKVLYVDNLTPDTIDVTMRRIANDDWDAVVVPHSLIDRMALSEETLMEIAADEIAALEQEAIEAAAEDGFQLDIADMDDWLDDPQSKLMAKVRSPTAKDLVRARNGIIKKIKDMGNRASKENAVKFEDLGVDMLLVDEVHEFKKPPVATKMRMKGLNTGTSNRSIALKFLADYVKRLNGGKGVHIFTGTPITNTLTEIFNMQRYVMDDVMARDGIATWDGWFNTFADATSEVELTATGEYEPVTRLAAFVNVAELRRLAGQYMDIVFADDMPEFKPREINGKTLADKLTDDELAALQDGRTENPIGRPYKRIVTDVGPMSPQQRAALDELVRDARRFKNATRKERFDLMRAGDRSSPVIVETNAANAGLDVRLYQQDAEDHPDSKVNRTVRNVLKHYQEHDRATQVVFVERGYTGTRTKSLGKTPDGKRLTQKVEGFNLVADLIEKLEAGGIPRNQIAVVDGKVSKQKRKETADKMNTAEVRVVIGLTSTLGVGVNMQRNLRAMHHMDAPWMPGDLEQRNGRGHRQGNQWNTVLEYRYVTEGLDGRRWQVLTVKDRFIKAFLKADDTVRIIDGDAVEVQEGESGDDLAETLAQAAGDPRLLQRNKLQADITKLEGRERLHTFGVADAKRQARTLRENSLAWQADLPKVRADAAHVAEIREAGTFEAQIDGKTYEKRDEADQAISDVVTNLERNKKVTIGTVQGFTLTAFWGEGRFREPEYEMRREATYSGVRPSVSSIESRMRRVAERADKTEENIEDAEKSIVRMDAAAAMEFQQAPVLERKRAQLDDLIRDLEANPAPPPSWLRHGAPVGAAVQVKVGDGFEDRVVEGHRWGRDNYYVVTDQGQVPYQDVYVELAPAYEPHPFERPVQDAATDQPAADNPTAETDEDDAALSLATVAPQPGQPQRDPQEIVAETLRRMKRLGLGDKVTVDFQDTIEHMTRGGKPVGAHGKYLPLERLMLVSLSDDAVTTVDHEAIHAMRALGLIRPAEWSALERHVRGNAEVMRLIGERYAPMNLTEPELVEEAIAQGFAEWVKARNGQAKGFVRTAYERIAAFLRNLRQVLSERDIATHEDVRALFLAIDRGEVGRRRERPVASGGERLATVYHGSPHDHDRFSSDKIGTGEGAQAYGWGLYFASAREIAEHYRRALAQDMIWLPSGKTMRGHTLGDFSDLFPALQEEAERLGIYPGEFSDHTQRLTNLVDPIEAIVEAWGNSETMAVADAREELQRLASDEEVERLVSTHLPRGEAKLMQAAYRQSIDLLDKLEAAGLTKQAGRLYKVNLKPTEDEYLLWDKPLSEQSEKVKAILDKEDMVPSSYLTGWRHDSFGRRERVGGMDGRQFYQRLANTEDSDRNASLALRDAGIRGIKYLDGSSRAVVGKPSVHFDGRTWTVDPNADMDPIAQPAATAAWLIYTKGGSIESAIDWIDTNQDADSREWRGVRQRLEDGRRADDLQVKESGDGSYNYVIFDDADIEIEEKFSLIGRDGASPLPAIVDHIEGTSRTLVAGLRDRLSRDKVGELVDAWRKAMQDRYLPLLRTQQAIEEAMGTGLAEAIDPYLAEELSSGRKGAKMDDLAEIHVRPLMVAMHEAEVTADELEAFLYARHAPERNARIAEINPAFEEGTGSGMTDMEAEAVMAAVEDSGKRRALEALAERIYAINRLAMAERVEAGLLSQAEADLWQRTYEFYVPLRGQAELDPEMANQRPNQQRGITVRGKESRMAFGRRSEARDILAYTLLQAQEAIVRGETNRVARAFHDLAQAAPDASFWRIDKVTRRPVFNSDTGQVEYRDANQLLAEDEPYTVSLKIEGVAHRVTMDRKNPDAVRLASAMRNLTEQKLDAWVRVMGGLNRFLSAINTTYNPEFVITNAFRDIQTAAINLNAEEIDGLVAGTLRDWKPALAASTKGAFGRYQGEWGAWYKEFRDQGGKVYFNQFEDLRHQRKKLRAAFRDAKPGLTTLKALNALRNTVDNINVGVENAVRLSAYKNAREAGMSPARAASLAKNVTVNFNRRGTLGPAVNAMYLFFNASIQGSAAILTAIGRSKRVRKVVVATVLAGAALEILNMLASGEDDDGELYYDKLSDFDKSRNLIVMIPGAEGEHIKIPLPYGYNVFYALGRSVAEAGRGKPLGKVAANLLTTTVDAFNPIGGTESLLNFLAPTILDPVVDIERNRDFADRPIMPEENQFGPKAPDSQRFWNSVSPYSKAITTWLNEATGGTGVEPGAIDVSPETLDHLFGVFTGAAGQFLRRNADTALKLFDPNEDVEIRDIPFARRVLGGRPTWYDRGMFYERTDRIEQLHAYHKGYLDKGDTGKAREFYVEHKAMLDLRKVARQERRLLSELRGRAAADRDLLDRGTITQAVYADRRRAAEDAERTILTRFNREYVKRDR